MKTLKAEKGKYLDLKPCLNCKATEDFFHPFNAKLLFCPCPNHCGEIQRDNGRIIVFSCENRKMHQLPNKVSKSVSK